MTAKSANVRELTKCWGKVTEMLEKKSCQGKLYIDYLRLGHMSVFIRLFWLHIAVLKGFLELFCSLSHFCYYFYCVLVCLQCLDAVSWAAGRASGM